MINLKSMIMLGLLSLALIFSSCTKDHLNLTVQEVVESSQLKYTKDIELLSENRKNKAILTLSSDDEVLLAKYNASNFELIPVYELSEPMDEQANLEFDDTDIDRLISNQPISDEPILEQELKMIEQEEGALRIRLAIKASNKNGTRDIRTFKTDKDIIRVTAKKGCNIRTRFYYKNYPGGGYHTGAQAVLGETSSCVRDGSRATYTKRGSHRLRVDISIEGSGLAIVEYMN